VGGRIVLVVTAPPGEPRVAPFIHEVARLFAPRGITCNAILVSAVKAPVRPAEPEDVAELIAFLASPTGAVVSGATLTVS
jgi:NAD(P)-dependent dehydrogenase (short-subunit alcohol dehydrogenase family)